MVLNSLFGARDVTAVGYRSPESGQTETYITLETSDVNWHLVKTVATGKTFFLSTFVASALTNEFYGIGTGEAASEVHVLNPAVGTGATEIINFGVPMGFPAGTKISVKAGAVQEAHFALIGCEE